MIKQLRIHHIRNLSQADGQTLDLGSCNIFIGKNGSGKTSLLEAIHLLSRGKSFRHHEPKRYISQSQASCTVWASLENGDTVAINKSKDATTNLRYNHNPVPSQSILTKILPTLIIDPANMHLLEDGSTARRQLLDWLCFHSDESFYAAWLGYQRLLKQRNSLLKHPSINTHAMISQIYAWDGLLSDYAHSLHQSRQQVFRYWQQDFEQMINRLLPNYHNKLKLSYQVGFDDAHPLKQTLRERLASDIELGYTRIGAHRADIGFVLDFFGKKESALHILSRGEKKLLITALKLSQLATVCKHSQVKPLVLIDDIAAELDDVALNRLLTELLKLPCQLFITSLDDKVIELTNTLTPSENIHRFSLQNGLIQTTDSQPQI